MIFYPISAFITSFTSIALGIWVVCVNRKDINILWFWNSVFIALWSFGLGFAYLSDDWRNAYFWIYFQNIVAIPISPLYFHFVITLIGKKNDYFSIKKSYIIFLIILVCALIFPKSFVQDVVPKVGFKYYVEPGIIYFFFATFYTVFLMLSAYVLLRESGKPQQTHKRNQLISMFLVSAIGYGGGATTFLGVFDIPFPPFGMLFVAFYTFIMAYSIIKHHLMDIEVILKRTLVFTGIVAIAVGAIAVPIGLMQMIIGQAVGIPPLALLILGVATTVIIYQPVAKFLVNLTDRYLFQKKIDYRKLLKEATEYLAHLDSLKRQARRIVAFLLIKARITNAALYAFQSYAPGSLLLEASRPIMRGDGHKTIRLSHPLVQYMRAHRAPVQLNELQEQSKKLRAMPKNDRSTEVLRPVGLEDVDAIIDLLKEHKAEAVIPCFGSDAVERARHRELHLRGILFLGHQKSDELYTKEDLDVFLTLGQESSIAFENARLYDEAVKKSRELEMSNIALENAQTKLMRSLKETEQANQRLKEMQVELIEAKRRALLAGISSAVGHEIRNPLTPILMHIYYVLKQIDDAFLLYEGLAPRLSESERERYLTIFSGLRQRFEGVQRGGERIQGVVNTLVNLVKERTETKSQVQLKLLLASAFEEVRFQTYAESLTIPEIVMDIPADLPFLAGITQDLQGVFVNLIINSLHAMEKTLEKRILIKAVVDPAETRMIRIDFTDNGCGIPREMRERIFEHGVTTKGEKGTGIGLFYCKDNVERVHGGSIRVQSEPGIGTTFTIRLPIYGAAEEPDGMGRVWQRS